MASKNKFRWSEWLLILAVIGGIGIMNFMPASARERMRKIGIRMAVGARGNDIPPQFLIEAVTLGAIGGILGMVAGAGSSYVIAVNTDWPTMTSPTAILVAFIFSAAVGVFFGFHPARKAAQLDPIEALRYE